MTNSYDNLNESLLEILSEDPFDDFNRPLCQPKVISPKELKKQIAHDFDYQGFWQILCGYAMGGDIVIRVYRVPLKNSKKVTYQCYVDDGNMKMTAVLDDLRQALSWCKLMSSFTSPLRRSKLEGHWGTNPESKYDEWIAES